jgi:uncharacterized protein DUF2252
MKNIIESTASFEAWLRSQIELYEPDLQVKHRKMAEDPFEFMRATFYRWAEVWPERCKALANTHQVIGVGDLHIENFGTWRDKESRMVWGVNDFDEVHECAFTVDLVRLAVSVELAAQETRLVDLTFDETCAAILAGYRKGLASGGQPFVLERRNAWLLRLARAALKEPKLFWKRWLDEKTEPVPSDDDLPAGFQEVMRPLFPDSAKIQFRQTRKGADPKGLGSLGHRRLFAYAEWQGGPVGREAKRSCASAFLWAAGKPAGRNRIMDFLGAKGRPMSPHVVMKENWLIRPVLAETGRIEPSELELAAPTRRRALDQERLLEAMAFETANVHLMFSSSQELKKAASELKLAELKRAVAAMLDAVHSDFKEWRKHWKTQPTKLVDSPPKKPVKKAVGL